MRRNILAKACQSCSRKQSCRQMATGSNASPVSTAAKAKKEGDISSVFVSLSGKDAPQLEERFAEIKRQLISGNEASIKSGWDRLLARLKQANAQVRREGPKFIPTIDFNELDSIPSSTLETVKERGVAVIRGVVPETEARGFKDQAEEYVKKNPWTKAFPSHDPQVFELYWSQPQVAARSHPNLIKAQQFLMGLWHSNDPSAPICTSRPLTYADRLRIRQPGDSGFALGPHVDGGSVERWEPTGYGLGQVYRHVFTGAWEQYDPWESSCRLPVVADLYEGAGACSMFRMFQGWLSMSSTNPGEGTLMVNPLLRLSTAYFLLRPFFETVKPPGSTVAGEYDPAYLEASNWVLKEADAVTPNLQGANPGHAQELNQILHPHLDLQNTMVHIPSIKPGDFVVWHCDTIHAVDKVHVGKTDSSVIYIPVCPTTESNARYLARQRQTFLDGTPGPDFPGGKGEAEHSGRPTEAYLRQHTSSDALKAMGLERLDSAGQSKGEAHALQRANVVLGFA